jgi:DNA-binding NarL/FixJ family response regulator
MISRTSSFVGADILSETKERTENIRGSSICIWMVDDNDTFRSLLAELLDYEEDLSCSRQFPSAEAVLEALPNETPPDIILLDIQMRGKSGLDAVRPIKTLSPSTLVLMLTTFYDSLARTRALRDGATDLLLKSFTVDEIARRIREAHGHRGETSVSPGESGVERKAEPGVDSTLLPAHQVESCRKPASRSAPNPFARGVSYLRTLLTSGRSARSSSDALPGSLGSGQVDCISE